MIIHKCARIDEKGNVSYKMKDGFSVARQVLNSLVQPQSLSKSQSSQCISRALSKHSKLDKPNVSRFFALLKREVQSENDRAKSSYEVVRSAYSRLPINLKPRRLRGIHIRCGEIIEADNEYIYRNLSKSLKRAVISRTLLRDKDKTKDYLPKFCEGNLIIAARVHASSYHIAQELGSAAIDNYLSILNFISSLGRGTTWFSNPVQPQAVVLPSSYTTVHSDSGKLIEDAIFFNPELALITPSGQNVSADQAATIEPNIDVVIRRTKQHFDTDLYWQGLGLFGSSLVGTEKNSNFLKCWMALECLMCFSQKESHESMIRRMRFILSKDYFDIEYAILETLREKRNSIAHKGYDISDERSSFYSDIFSTLIQIVARLLRFHLNLPPEIKTKDDFLYFTSLPMEPKSLKTRQALNNAMLKHVI